MGTTSSTFQSTEKRPNLVYQVEPISSVVVPVEVFVIFIIRNNEKFTINAMVNIFYQRTRIKLRFERMQQIIEDLVSAGKVAKTKGISKKNRPVAIYSFKKIA